MLKLDLSIVIPIYNEAESLPALYERTSAALKKTGLSYEIIFVDDCSMDTSLKMINQLRVEDPTIKIISFSRNFGHQVAITAGLQYSNGCAVVIMDADLQDPPEVISDFVKKWKEGFEVVCGVRIKRNDSFIRRIEASIYYRLLKRLSSTPIDLDSGDFCLMDRKVVDLINAMPERNRFVRGLRNWVGFNHTSVEFVRDKRRAGKTKYSLSRRLKFAISGIVSFSAVPLKISLSIGFLVSFISIIYALFIVGSKILNPSSVISGWSSLVVSVALLGGIQLIVLGLLGEYILNIADEVKKRPQYIIRYSSGFSNNETKDISNNSRT